MRDSYRTAAPVSGAGGPPCARPRNRSVGTTGLVLLDIALILAVTRVLRGGLGRLRQPPVMAEVLAGAALGTLAPAALFPGDALDVLSVLGQVAAVGYLFCVAARLDHAALRREGRTVATLAVATFALPFAGGAALGLALHPTVAGAPPLPAFVLFMGTAIAVTALPVLARIVEATGLRGHSAARLALSAAAAQELLVWPALAASVALAAPGGRAAGTVVAAGVAAALAVVLAARFVAPRVRPAAMLVLLATSAAATELAGLHAVLGAFLFGAAAPRAQSEAALALLRARPAVMASALALPLFFAVPALRADLGAVGGDGIVLLALVLAVAVVTKLAGAFVALRGRADALTVGVLMNARGLVELVVLSVGLDAGLLDVRLYAVLLLVALLTTFAVGPLLRWASPQGFGHGCAAGTAEGCPIPLTYPPASSRSPTPDRSSSARVRSTRASGTALSRCVSRVTTSTPAAPRWAGCSPRWSTSRSAGPSEARPTETRRSPPCR